MKRILIEIDDRFVTEWGHIYFGVRPGANGLEFFIPPEPSCLPGFKYVVHPEANNATFKFRDVDALKQENPVDPHPHSADDFDQAKNA